MNIQTYVFALSLSSNVHVVLVRLEAALKDVDALRLTDRRSRLLVMPSVQLTDRIFVADLSRQFTSPLHQAVG